MLPLGDENRNLRIFPVVNMLLIVLNVLVFLYETSLGAGVQNFIERFGAIPANILAGEGVLTLLTSMFLHGGWAHLIGNMLFLWIFGDNVEDAFGHGLYLAFYLLTGLAASAAHILLNPGSTVPSVGASGAISGVLGAYILMFGSNPIRVLIFFTIMVVPAWLMIGLWAVQQFISTFAEIGYTEQTSGVAYAAHAGGFLAGLVLTLALRPMIADSARRVQTRQALGR